MKIDDGTLKKENELLFKQLGSLREELDTLSLERHGRLNPFSENLLDWNKKGEAYGGERTTIYDTATLIGDVKIGHDCWVGPFCMLDGSHGLTIGHHCVMATGVHIYTHDTVRWALSGGISPYEYGSVIIGDCSFIGAQSIIVRGVTVGERSLVCANATVTTDVPPYSIVGGTPAKVIGHVVIDGDEVRLEYFPT